MSIGPNSTTSKAKGFIKVGELACYASIAIVATWILIIWYEVSDISRDLAMADLHAGLAKTVSSMRTELDDLRAALANGTYATVKPMECPTGREAPGKVGGGMPLDDTNIMMVLTLGAFIAAILLLILRSEDRQRLNAIEAILRKQKEPAHDAASEERAFRPSARRIYV